MFLSKTVFVAKGRLEKIEFPYLPEYGDNVYLTLLFFNDYSYQKFDANYYHEKILRALPLAVTRFTDSAAPSSEVTVELESVPGAEAVASVWDKAADVIRMNRWGSVYVPFKEALPIFPDVAVFKPYYGSIRAYGLAVQSYAEDIVNAKGVVIDDDEVEKAAPSAVRSVFSEALYFDPYLKADAEGRVRLSFKTSDKLSTYRMAVFAHDSQLRSSVIEKEFKVTIPVKVDVLKPEYLYDGDEFSLTATVSSGVASDLSGNLAVYQYDGSDYRNLQPLAVTSETVTIPAGGVVKHQFGIRTEAEGASSPTLGLLVSFKGDDGTTDAMFFTVPVLERAQTLTESHSAVLYGGADREALMKDLQGRFTGTTAYGAVAGEISVLDMVKEVLDGKLGEPREDIVSLTEALYVRVALSHLKEISPNDNMGSLLEKIFALQNEDGGFAWFKGFKSSPILTALVLERFHKMRFLNLSEAEVPLAKAVKYLDANQFSKEPIHCWRGGLSQEQYLYVRAAYASVPFEVPYKSSKDLYKNFERDIDGCIMAKARRLATLKLLAASAEGEALAKAWGIKSPKKLKASADADAASLVQYAVRHRDGGWYYPNAVMPWRGLLETEAYAHTILASLLPSADLANGIRLWLMLQKETQHWDTTPHFVDAVACILEGSKEVLDTINTLSIINKL